MDLTLILRLRVLTPTLELAFESASSILRLYLFDSSMIQLVLARFLRNVVFVDMQEMS